MIICRKEFKLVSECVSALNDTGLKFADEFYDSDVETFDDFTDRCISLFKSHHVNTDSIYYRPDERFDLTISKFGTFISFDNNTSIGIYIINTDSPTGYEVEIVFRMPAETVFKSAEYKRLVNLGWTIINTETYKTNGKYSIIDIVDLEKRELSEEARFNIEKRLRDEGLIE